MDIGSWFQTWLNVTTRPGEPTFELERTRPYANLTTAAIWVGLVALVAGIFSLIQGAIAARQLQAVGGLQGILNMMDLPPDIAGPAMDQLNQLPAGFIPGIGRPAFGIGALISGILGAIIFFIHLCRAYCSLWPSCWAARAASASTAFCLRPSTCRSPLSAACWALCLVLGGCVSFILWIYQLVLAYYATRVEHKLSSGRSIMVVLAPLLILFVVGCCFVGTIGGIVGAIMSSGR